MCAIKGKAGEVTQALGGAQKILSWIPDIGQLEFDFASHCDCALKLFPLEGSILVEPTVKRLLIVKILDCKRD
ncbi:hypothetical protein CEK60_21745 [Halomonas sp. N3-2A]|nr:hypothetical protein CEK60_21745 [Halomonas sp. N3-2A]